MMLSGPSPGTEHYKEATLFISRVLDGASISPRSNGVTGYKQTEEYRKRESGREREREIEREGGCRKKKREIKSE